MENKVQVDFIVHEAALARLERINKRLTFLLYASLAVDVLTNLYWLYVR